MNPDLLACHALLNCLIREVSAPEGQVREEGGHLLIRLARSGVLLRAELRRPSAGIGPRPSGVASIERDGRWEPVGWQRLADLIADELTHATGSPNSEFAAQVRDGHAAFDAILRAHAASAVRARAASAVAHPASAVRTPEDERVGRYLASEQALVAGHRFHPSPKTRQGRPDDWLRYAPEARARFPLRFLAVREDLLADDGDTSALDGLGGAGGEVPPSGYRLLPAHPWQFALMAARPWLREALRQGLMIDLGDGARDVVPTSSVRTVYDPVADVFCKFSLDTRITNCVRTSTWYELAGSVLLTRLLAPMFADIAGRCPGTVLLGEPGYRTVSLASRDAYEGLAVIVRDGVRNRVAPGVTPLLAASLAEPYGEHALTANVLFDGRDDDWLLSWWRAYVRTVAPPVLDAYFRYGVVLEPHLQNVLVGVDADGLPVQAIFRDLEGTKLVSSRHAGLLAGLAPGIARGLGYDARQAWDRVAYCLLVNHLAELAAALADRCGHDRPHAGEYTDEGRTDGGRTDGGHTAGRHVDDGSTAGGHAVGGHAVGGHAVGGSTDRRPTAVRAEGEPGHGRAAEFERALWAQARQVLTDAASEHAWPPQLRAVLAGVPLPAKANLRVRWARAADRDAAYVPVPNPLRGLEPV